MRPHIQTTNNSKRINLMKNILKTLTVCASILSAAATSAFAQTGGGIFSFDEMGNATLNNAPWPTLGLINDPTGGSPTGFVLAYSLPGLVLPGDLALTEPNTPTGTFSDVVRFFNAAGAGKSLLLFYSDVSAADPADSLADVGIPRAPNAIVIPETGPEVGPNGALWAPTPGLPGFDTTGVIGTYDIMSDPAPTPEPGSAALVLGGLALLAWRNHLRRSAA
jgi:hypothetical protein